MNFTFKQKKNDDFYSYAEKRTTISRCHFSVISACGDITDLNFPEQIAMTAEFRPCISSLEVHEICNSLLF